MALAVTLKASGVVDEATTDAAATQVLGAITFTAGSLVFIILGGINGQAAAALTDLRASASGLTFSQEAGAIQAGVADKAWLRALSAPHASGGSTTITIDSNGMTVYGLFYAIYEVTGHDTGNPTGAFAGTAQQATLDNAYSITLGSAPATSSIVIAGITADTDAGTNTVTPGTGWTEDVDVDSTASFYGFLETQRRTGSTSTTVTWDDIRAGASVALYSTAAVAVEINAPAGPVTNVTRIEVTTGAPGAATAFAPTLPTHAAGDRLTLAVVGKYETTTIPTINQGWTLVKSGTGGTGTAANDTGQTFWAVYAKDATSGAETAPTVTPGGTAPNSWEWICATHRPASGKAWADTIAASAAWVQSASDTTTASPLTGTAGAWTGAQPTTDDAIFAIGVIPTDLGTALGATTLTATGLSGGTKDTATSQYIENALNADTAAVWAGWTSIVGTASAGLALSFTVTGATNQSGSLIAIALRQQTAGVTGTATGTFGFTTAADGVPVVLGTATGLSGFTGSAAGSKIVTGAATGTLGYSSSATGTVIGGGATITGTATGVFGFTGPAAGVPAKLGTATGLYGFTSTATGQPTKLGTATGAFGFSCPASGSKIVTGIGTGAFVFAAPVAGAAFKLGIGTGAFGFTAPATGITVGAVFGTATGVFGFTTPSSGTRLVASTSTQGFGFTSTATGQPERLGTATGLFGFVAAAQGSKTVTGVATGAFGFDAPVSGVPAKVGAATGLLGFTSPANGLVTKPGTAIGSFGFTAPAQGQPAKTATATADFGFTAPATGAPSRAGEGTATGLFGFNAPASGQSLRPGTATGTFGFTATANGVTVGAVTGTATSAFGFTAPTSSIRTRLGTSTNNLGFTAPATGQLIRLGTATSELGFNATASANPPPDYNGEPWNTTPNSPTWAATTTNRSTSGPINDEWEANPTGNQWQATLTPQWATQ